MDPLQQTAYAEPVRAKGETHMLALLRFIRALLHRLLRLIERLIAALSGGSGGPTPPPTTCPIGWQPSVLAPVFYGIRDYMPADGAPFPCRVFFPSLDGAVFYAPILEGCGRYPLILFAHGNCDETEHYKKWYELPAQLARSGYVVAAPELPDTAAGVGPWSEPHADMGRLAALLAWMRDGWEHSSVLQPAPSTGIVGHSYGALLAARFAAVNPISAYASLSGVWSEWPGTPPRPINVLTIPKLFTWGSGIGDIFAALDGGPWDALTVPKHRAVFADAGHWDYLPAGRSICENQRGSCTLVTALANDLVATFFGKYLPPELWPDLGTDVPDSLVPPPLVLTEEQQFFAGGHLFGFQQIGNQAACSVALGWVTANGSGSQTVPQP
jgi:pimeloyl-ACP methyl ester carboxylesterase